MSQIDFIYIINQADTVHIASQIDFIYIINQSEKRNIKKTYIFMFYCIFCLFYIIIVFFLLLHKKHQKT